MRGGAVAQLDAFVTEDSTLVNAALARIDPLKLVAYALDPDHSRGGHKAIVFDRALGFNHSNVDELTMAIREGVQTTAARQGRVTRCGPEFVVDLVLREPTGREAIVRTRWMYHEGERFPILTTALVQRRRPDARTATP